MAKQSRKELIINEATIIFKQKGYSATSMRELAEKVGIEAASLYNHIRSKDEILEEICFSVAHEYLSFITEIEERDWTYTDKLKGLIDLHIKLMIERPNDVSVANNDWKNLSDPKKKLYKEVRKGYENRIANILTKGMQAGEFRQLHVSVALFTLLSSLRWIELWYRPGRDVTPDELKHDLTTFLVHGLKN